LDGREFDGARGRRIRGVWTCPRRVCCARMAGKQDAPEDVNVTRRGPLSHATWGPTPESRKNARQLAVPAGSRRTAFQ
jgi:hypothetical protein